MQYTAANVLIAPETQPGDPDLLLSITPERAGWEYISFQVRKLAAGQQWSFETGESELALVNLTGRYAVNSNRGAWKGIGGRENVFAGAAMPCTSLGARNFTVQARSPAISRLPGCRPAKTTTPGSSNPRTCPSRYGAATTSPGRSTTSCPRTRRYTGLSWLKSIRQAEAGAAIRRTNTTCISKTTPMNSSKPTSKRSTSSRPTAPKATPTCACTRTKAVPCTRPRQPHRRPRHAPRQPRRHRARGIPPRRQPPGYTTYYLNVLAGSAQCLANQDDPRYT